jgi:hypothetical protein
MKKCKWKEYERWKVFVYHGRGKDGIVRDIAK